VIPKGQHHEFGVGYGDMSPVTLKGQGRDPYLDANISKTVRDGGLMPMGH